MFLSNVKDLSCLDSRKRRKLISKKLGMFGIRKMGCVFAQKPNKSSQSSL